MESNGPTPSVETRDPHDTLDPHDSHEPLPTDLPKVSKTTLIVVGIVILGVFVTLFLAGYIPHRNHMAQLVEQANEVATQPPIVDVAPPTPGASQVNLPVPGDVYPWQETAIFSRVNGYLKKWYFDIGAHVEAGQVLAEIDAPDTDAQLNQSRAALEQAKANVVKGEADLELAQATYTRYHGLLSTGGVTQQDLDQRESDLNQARAEKAADDAAVKSAQATVEQLEAQQGFETIVAPFSGTITRRTYDVGALISTTKTDAGQELFRIAETDKLRIFAKVPQPYVTLLRPHEAVSFEVRNYPGRRFTAYLDRTAGALDQTSRTLLTQLDYDNRDSDLFAGMYGEVDFNIQNDKPVLTVPTSALMFEAEGLRLAVVDGTTVHFRKVTVGRDFGTSVEVLTGLSSDDQVVTNPGTDLADGITVEVVAQQEAPASPVRVANALPTTAPAVAQTDPPPAGSAGK
ncbi:MAG: efflux RND transporter periplasmic adaptor subunit [Tepidisphaeraceae bacterium]|jgi:RND family efflux transporter MFP subunit